MTATKITSEDVVITVNIRIATIVTTMHAAMEATTTMHTTTKATTLHTSRIRP
jgi:hypothetical protein